MSDARVSASPSVPRPENKAKKLAPEKYFALPMNILLFTGLYPISSKHNFIVRFLFSIYGWSLFVVLVLLNPISKAIALPSQTNLNELTDNISFLINHIMAIIKIAVFWAKRNDLMRLVEAIESPKFRHEDCSEEFSANDLISGALWTTQMAYGVFSVFVIGLISSSIINAATGVSEEILNTNGTEFAGISSHRTLPFLSWYPFSTQTSPMYEIIFAYQISAIFITAQIVMALDTLSVGFMVHIKNIILGVCIAAWRLLYVSSSICMQILIEMQSIPRIFNYNVQFRILSHNLRFMKSHATNQECNDFSTIAKASDTISEVNEGQFTQAIESDLKRNIVHHQAITELSKDLDSVFTYQLLMQFVCSLFACCALLWQVSSTPVLSAKFASMLSYLGATAFQLFIFCWFGNNMMLESLSVADAAWDSKWWEILSRRYAYGIAMIIHRSQKATVITAGGFTDLSLDTFMMIIRAAYSVFAVLKKTNV